MKLYVFLVNTGTTLTFDTELTVQTVADLKHAIQSKYKIAIQHQVLVVNGGECMATDRRVCTYSAGTETNPIFLFNKEMILCERPPAIPKTTFSTENDMEIKVEESLMMPAVFHTVASRTQLAVEMYEIARKLCSFCEGLVHDEHLQHQGWAAIMANLEDCSNSYQKLLFKFESIYSNYLQSIEDIKLKLTHLGTTASVMAKIPLLECLTRHSYRECLGRLDSLPEHEGSEKTEIKRSTELVLSSDMSQTTNKSLLTSFHKSMEHVAPDNAEAESGKEIRESCHSTVQHDESSVDPKDSDLHVFNVSLLDWINVQDRPNDVESLVRKCFESMSRLDPRTIRPFLAECRQTIAKLDHQNMKAIKGLEDRLYALDQMIASCSRLVNEQKELAQGFLSNQMRAENLKDASVLPDLCLSHANQLMIMLQNHRKLLDIKQKCTTAKQELANNLHVRLKWCCFVMLHADQDGEKLQALLRLVIELLERVKIVEALSTVPQMYCLAVVEVVRRKMFIKHYREWAGALVKDGKQLYEAEKSKRESFGKLFRKSFLRNHLFRGLDSWPSSFCTQKPRKFDCELPDISLKDLQFLQSFCPSEVQPFLRVPLLCDFEPLHQHVMALHNLVKAAQSLDEMSQTITDLLSEQKTSASQASPQSASSPRIESATGISTTTSSRTPPPLTVQDPLCPAVCPLEELSPDSIDAHTFDFETIPHPNIEQTLDQGSLDLDSLAESPESDFMSAVNEFVIEENLSSPNPISDPQSPEMMVESLYSSVINAIDSRRMQDTNICSKEDSGDHASSVQLEKCRVVAQDSHVSIQIIKEKLCYFRTFVQKEKCDFSNSLKCTALEIRNMIEKIKCSLVITLQEKHQKELQTLKNEYEVKLDALIKESEENEKKIKKLKGDIVCLEEVLQSKDNEFALVKHEKEAVICLQNEKDQKLLEMENIMHTQSCEIKELKESRETVLGDLKKLHIENDEKIQLLRAELQCLEQSHLKELEDTLQLAMSQEQDREQLIQKLTCDKEEAIQTALKEFKMEREAVEKELLEKVQHLETQLAKCLATESVRDDSSSLVSELQEKLQEEKAKFLEQLEEQEKRKNEEMQNVRTSLIAEQQTNFNTVLTREKKRKETIINDLSDKLKSTMQQQERDKDLIESLSEDRARLLEEKKKLEEEVSKLRSGSFVPSPYVAAAPEYYGACAPDLPGETEKSTMDTAEEGKLESAMETSMMSVQENIHMLSEEKQRIMLLERTLQLKEEENKRLNQRLMSQSMSSVSSRHSEKIAIRDFQVGDLVLIILDERHDNYVLFTVSPTLYFLHSESLPGLDLKPGEGASGASRRPWVLGKVMEKEYCQAKKAQNRFKVPLGTKFYRVKAVSWNKKV
ncbi:PREDICTED: RB1-inducible coiled-coil protein 1-like [Elephantulus edwardii]|uniref:RB1-inducible coiled-coil protein 1-like n=1 Tax=Elephantulus edwardii TaxID=28737 RepID=UPI0003F08B37|nr:PREDICTED: RB1-inducible coiled-coil protein 1-like [Elephantulus edwardii]